MLAKGSIGNKLIVKNRLGRTPNLPLDASAGKTLFDERR